MGCATLELAGRWVELALSVETEIFGRALANCYYVGLGRLWWASVLNLALPPQRLRPDTSAWSMLASDLLVGDSEYSV